MRQWPWLSKIEPPLKGCNYKFAPKSSSSCPSPGSSPLTSLHHHPHKYINKCLALQRFCSNYWFVSKEQPNHTSPPSCAVERQLETRQSFDPTIWPIHALHLEVEYTTHTKKVSQTKGIKIRVKCVLSIKCTQRLHYVPRIISHPHFQPFPNIVSARV